MMQVTCDNCGKIYRVDENKIKGAKARLKCRACANVIIVTDFISVIPAFVLSSVWLWQRRVWGYVLSGVLFIQAVTLGISIVAGQVVAFIKGVEPAYELAVFFLLFTLFGLVLATFYTKNLRYKRVD